MFHHDGQRRFIAPLTLILMIGMALAGCGGGGHNSAPNAPNPPAPDPVFVQITVGGVTYTYSKGPVKINDTSFTGIASGCYCTFDSTSRIIVYGSKAEASGNIFGDDNFYVLVDFDGGTTPGTYNGNYMGRWRKDASNAFDLACTQVIIEEYGAVGSRIKGTFTGTYVDDEKNNIAFTGSFNVQRFPDDNITEYFL